MSALRFSVVLTALSLAGCNAGFPIRMRSADDGCGGPNPEMLPLPSLGQDPHPFDVLHAPERMNDGPGQSYVYRFELERSGTTETLRAIVRLRGKPPLVVGDRGIALIRDSKAGWMRETTGTTENLNAIVVAPFWKDGETVEQAEARASYVAVGSHGAALVRGPDAVWRSETTGTTADLFGLWHRGKSTVAVGAGGVMVERSEDGVWRDVPTHTTADLYAIGVCNGHLCAVGAGGAVVDCVGREGGGLACVPRKPPTSAALHVVTDEEQFLGEGVWLSIKPDPKFDNRAPLEWVPWRFADASVEKSDARATANNHWVGIGERLVVGRGGAVWLVGNWVINQKPVQKIELPYAVDFYGATYELVDGFFVGEKGTIVKMGVLGFVPPLICLL